MAENVKAEPKLKTTLILEVPANSKVRVSDLQEASGMPGAKVKYDKKTGDVTVEIDPEEAKKK